jgi:methyltransferase (TIGR00027 family)
MDTRAYRLDLPAPCVFFEIDQPAVVEAKHAALAGCTDLPAADVRRIPADLAGAAWPTTLLASGYHPAARSCWILEGLLYYLADDQVDRLLARIRALASPGSVVVGDLVSRTGMDAPHLRPMLDVYAGWGTPWIFGTDEPAALFDRHGFAVTVVQPGEPAADYGRWHDPVPPIDDRDVERMFLVHGERR